jgi:hypothetical protein
MTVAHLLPFQRRAPDLFTHTVCWCWRRSLTQALTIVIQTGLDAGAAYGAFSLAGFLGAAESIPLHNIWGFGATFLGSYFGEQFCYCPKLQAARFAEGSWQ